MLARAPPSEGPFVCGRSLALVAPAAVFVALPFRTTRATPPPPTTPPTASRCAVLRRRLTLVTRWVIGCVLGGLARVVAVMCNRAGFINVARVVRPVVLFGAEVVAARCAVFFCTSAPRAPVAPPLRPRCGPLSAFGTLAHRRCFGAHALRHIVHGEVVLGLAVAIHGA